MHGCLVRIVLLVAVVVAAAWLLAPIAADALIAGALTAAGFQGTGTVVDAQANPPPLLLTGHADTVEIRSSNVTLHELRAGALDLTLSDVNVLAHSFTSADGTMRDIRIVNGTGPGVEAATASIHGPAAAARVLLQLDPAQTKSLVTAGVAAASGPTPAEISLAPPDRVTLRLAGQAVAARIAVQDGSLVLIGAAAGADPIVLAGSAPGAIWRMNSVNVTPGGVDIGLLVDLESLLR